MPPRLGHRYLDHKKFGRTREKRPIHDRRKPGEIVFDPKPNELMIGRTGVISPHFDDAGLNAPGAIYLKGSGGEIHIVNVVPGHKAPIEGIENPEDRIAKRLGEGRSEADILGAEMTYLDLRGLYEKKRFTSAERRRFFSELDRLDFQTLVIPSENDANKDHQNVREASLDWAAERAWKGRPVVIVEADSMWGTVPEKYLTHAIRLTPELRRIRNMAQRVHTSQWKRTNFPRVSKLKAQARGVILGEHMHGLVPKTPDLGPCEAYSQNILHRIGRKLVLERISAKHRGKYGL